MSVWPLAALTALGTAPAPAQPPLDAPNGGLSVTGEGRKRLLVGQFNNAYRSSDGKAWQRLLPSLDLNFGYATAAAGAIFITGVTSQGGEGVWRSLDGGTTWEWLTGGLTDLSPAGPVLARTADEAYFFNRGQGLLRWDGAARKWELVDAPEQGTDWTSLALAPDGALFRGNGGNLERSADQGATWTTLAPTAKTGDIIGFSALYTVTKTIFSSLRSADYRITAVQRSPDGGKTWQPSLTSAQLKLDGFPPVLATGYGRTYLLTQPDKGEPSLLRTKDDGETWEIAPPGTAKGAQRLAVDPLDGRVWLGIQGGVRAVDPDKLRWTNVAAPRPTPAPTAAKPAAGATPTPTRGPCGSLTGQDAEIDARGLGIGCPRGPGEGVPMARQRFQKGQMIWREDLRSIYVIYDDGRWEEYPDKWVEGDPADDPKLSPPPGFQQPVRGFGKVWREKLGGAKAQVGWALQKEQGVLGQAQEWTHGTVLRFGGEVIVLGDAGRWW